MRSTKTRRRHRGRAIRKRRRALQAATTPTQALQAFEDELSDRAKRLQATFRAAWSTVLVMAHRLTPALLPPDSRGAGARRQLLHQGRAPRSTAGRRW